MRKRRRKQINTPQIRSLMNKRRVVVTGLGAVTPVGKSVDEMWKSIRGGECGIDKITLFDASSLPVRIAAEVKDFDPETQGINPRDAHRMARFTQFLLAASLQAVKDADLSPEMLSHGKTGLVAGNGLSGFDVQETAYEKYFKSGATRIPPLAIPMFIPNEGAANVSIKLGISGPAWTIATACASGTDALGASLDLIRSGRLDVCLAGGAESSVTGFAVGAFNGMHALASCYNDTPKSACRPFDVNRAGFTIGEGGAILVLEELEHARARAFADSGIAPSAIQYYNAHGTSTKLNDPTETKMLKIAFGDAVKHLRVSSTKSMTGHCIGAAGAIEATIGILAMRDGFYPPTINLSEPDVAAGCDLDYIPNVGASGNIDCFASASLGFGGHNGAVIMKKLKD